MWFMQNNLNLMGGQRLASKSILFLVNLMPNNENNFLSKIKRGIERSEASVSLISENEQIKNL